MIQTIHDPSLVKGWQVHVLQAEPGILNLLQTQQFGLLKF